MLLHDNSEYKQLKTGYLWLKYELLYLMESSNRGNQRIRPLLPLTRYFEHVSWKDILPCVCMHKHACQLPLCWSSWYIFMCYWHTDPIIHLIYKNISRWPT